MPPFGNGERLKKAQRIGLTPEEVSTLASIVEEETANGPENPWSQDFTSQIE